MKRNYLIVLISILSLYSIQAQKRVQKLDEYTASNGITYEVGDEIKLGRGSDTDGRFVYVNMAGWGAALTATNNAKYNAEQNRLGSTNSGLIVTVKKIKEYNKKRFKGVIFTVGGGNITNYTLDIENAIATCEIDDCSEENETAPSSTDKYDQLAKLKELFDSGVLTEEEFESEKKKILEGK
ncbi:putative oligomerization/nucleic acid binding protein [Salegentibacter sp. 24]|uniref:SHOCT domain-containing protein n=1 Tax=Salegentibacter sp. 24 TaxID=2183986 RepID=UPI00105D2DAA|nr:SHOCT domain-containing protein [Salegentibacter sp. 24]TDN80361.1 putative oligomerization/nucleic acid binding protein [Salegentibacter sp. 24]